MNAHGELEGQGRGIIPAREHFKDLAAEEMGVIKRAVSAVDRLGGVLEAAEAKGGAAAGAVVHVNGFYVGVGHVAAVARGGDLKRTIVGAVVVITDFLVAAGARAVRCCKAIVEQEHLLADCIEDVGGTCGMAALKRVREKADRNGQGNRAGPLAVYPARTRCDSDDH